MASMVVVLVQGPVPEVARLKQENPDMPHKDRCGALCACDPLARADQWGVCRFKLVIDNWNKQKESK